MLLFNIYNINNTFKLIKMRDIKKFILFSSLWIIWLIVIWIIIYFIFTIFLKKERPPLDVPVAFIQNYKGTYDSIILDELWVKFKIRSWWEVIKKTNSYSIKWDKYNMDFQVIPFNMEVLQTTDSLKKYGSKIFKYSQLDNIELNWEYKEAYWKNRWDIFINKQNKLIRVLSETSFKDNNTPIWSIEVLEWNINDIYKIFINYFWTKEQESIKNKYVLNEDDKAKWLDYHNYFQTTNNKDFDYEVIWFWWVFNENLTNSLNKQVLEKINSDFKKKYNVDLENSEKDLYMEKIKNNKNRFFNAITFKRIIVKNNNIYLFTYESLWNNLELVNILNNDYSTFFLKDIEITEPKKVLWWKQDTFSNIQFIIPISHIKNEISSTKEKYIMSPTVKYYKTWTIVIKSNRKEERNETIDEVYKKNIQKYITDSLSISNKTISDVELLKSDNINLWWFEWKWNIFKFKTVNNNDFIYIEYLLFDKNIYYTIWFSYWENEKELVKYFDELVKSINKIN